MNDKKYSNKITLEFDSNSSNERLARVVVSALVMELDPMMDELNDLKTAVSEAVTNAIVHGYDGCEGTVRMSCQVENNEIIVEIEDKGVGIPDIQKAREPLFTTKKEEERSGMGFMFMEVFMDNLEVYSEVGKGTKVVMRKKFYGNH